MAQTLTINLLGTPEFLLDGQPVTGLASRKAEALLAYLASNPRPHPRDALAALLWDDRSPQRALGNLSVLLSSMRKQLAPFFIADRQEIAIDEESDYRLDTAVFTTTITTARRQIRRQGHTTQSNATQLSQALDRYRGDFMAGFTLRDAAGFEEWKLLEQERLQRLAVEALDKLVDFHLERGKYKIGIEQATRLVQLDPLQERAHRQLMRLLAADGQRNAALEQYDRCCEILAKELGVSPTEETTQLFHAIRRGELAISSVIPATRHNLPAPPTSFIGREAELARIDDLLARPACRLLTLVGPGGVGKTRLLLEAARRQRGDFLHGVWFVPLASLEQSDWVETAVADGVGFDFAGQKTPRAQLLAYLRGKEMLLALDSFEHLLDESTAELLSQILAGAPHVKLLVSSRIRLNLQAEWLLEVAGMPVSNADDEEAAAMRLFVERGRQVRPDLAPAAEAQAIRRICRAVGGVPLAIELAAASLRFYTCGQIAEALKENLDFLSSSQRDLPARHRSLRAIFNHSWRLLDEEGRQAFAALAVFRGSFTPDAARAVLDSASPLLHELVDQSLLQRADAGRFRLHNTLRQYALEKLAADSPHQHEAARDRHGAYYTALLAKMRPRLRGGGQKEALEVITAEIENLRAGWRYLSTSQRRTERLPVLHDAADAWFWFFYQRSRFREGAALLQETITRFTPPAAAGERLLLARLRARYGWLAYLADDGENGRAALTQALAAFEEIDYAAGVLFCCNYLGASAAFRAQYERAETLLQRALTLAQALDDKSGESIALNIMGTMATQRGRLARAADLLRQSLALKRGIDDRWGVAFSLESLGAVDAQRQRPDAAAVRYRESLAIRQEMGDRRGVALCLQRLGDLAAQCGDAARAAELYGECLAILEDIGATAAVTAVRQKVANLSAKM